MKREIKFRAFHKPSGAIMDVHTLHWDSTGNLIGGYVHDSDQNEIAFDIKDVELMQFTGKTDKSRKGLFDGDLLKGGIFKVYEVEWDFEDNGWNVNDSAKAFEIIGNIYENESLLK